MKPDPKNPIVKEVFIDSGAFSAFTSGGMEIDVYEYIDFLKAYEDVFDHCANLDIIPNARDSEAEKRRKAERTLQNQRIMEEAGLSPVPVYHLGEPLDFLQYYVDNYDYIAIGGVAGKSKSGVGSNIPIFDHCFTNYICDKDGYPTTKVHAFGVASLTVLLRYPWYSVDTVSWVHSAVNGTIYVPHFQDGEYIHSTLPQHMIGVSSLTKVRGLKKTSLHLDSVSPRFRELVVQYIEDLGGRLGKSEYRTVPASHKLAENEQWRGKGELDPSTSKRVRLLEVIEEPGVTNSNICRMEHNIRYFQNLEASLPEWPWPFRSFSLRQLVL